MDAEDSARREDRKGETMRRKNRFKRDYGFAQDRKAACSAGSVPQPSSSEQLVSSEIEEPEWEKHRSVSLSELLDVYSDGVELLQLVKAPDSNCSSLSIATRQGLVLLREQDLMPLWKLSLHGLHSQPTPGSFTDDQTLDFLLQTAWSWDEKDDGGGWSSGSIIWSHSIPCHMEETPTTSAVTSDQKSVFLFWAEALAAASLSSDDAPGAKPPGLYHLTSCTQPSRLSCT
ncbi:protein FAM234B-like [Alexandromys fortis]|uniref:protein FAM234B-like n=1 Tax=Alexandromys fortis TaxID=100897 RepID=UPI002152D792|nr:protein FAM234B-like [Microtus fortis]